MAAFTTFSEAALARYLVMFGKGDLAGYTAIEGGIENSNYFITLNRDGLEKDYVLTIIETLTFAEVPFFSKVMTHLKHYGLQVAAPETTLDGMTSTIFCGKPTLLLSRLTGSHLEQVTPAHCQVLGEFMATSHQALSELNVTRENPYDLAWIQATANDVLDRLDPEHQTQLRELVSEAETIEALDLPRGLIHGDLFLDNALFDGTELTGVIDFYHTADDFLIRDLAIAINDWCYPNGQLDAALRDALMAGYESVRPLEEAERAAFKDIQRHSALRFALTRLLSGDPPLKDPKAMLDLAANVS